MSALTAVSRHVRSLALHLYFTQSVFKIWLMTNLQDSEDLDALWASEPYEESERNELFANRRESGRLLTAARPWLENFHPSVVMRDINFTAVQDRSYRQQISERFVYSARLLTPTR